MSSSFGINDSKFLVQEAQESKTYQLIAFDIYLPGHYDAFGYYPGATSSQNYCHSSMRLGWIIYKKWEALAQPAVSAFAEYLDGPLVFKCCSVF